MRTFRSKSGPFREQPFYTPDEIERLCTADLREVELFPAQPEPIRIERFISKRFKVSPEYQELPDGVLGWTRFGSTGVEAIIVSRALGESRGVVDERRVTSTLAHEAGHGLLHAHLFAPGLDHASLFPTGGDVEPHRILCRETPQTVNVAKRGYDGRWWEVQANMAMAALLLPRSLVELRIDALLVKGSFGRGFLPSARRADAVSQVAETFEVNPIMARLRLGEIFPAADVDQLTL